MAKGKKKGVSKVLSDIGDYRGPAAGGHLPHWLTSGVASLGNDVVRGGKKFNHLMSEPIFGGGGGGGGGQAAAPGPAGPSYLDQALGQYDTSSIDPEKLKQHLAFLGINPNDKKAVDAAVSQLNLPPGYLKTTAGSDPLSMQLMFSQVIAPYLQKFQDASKQGADLYDQESSTLKALNPGAYQGPMGALLGQLQAGTKAEATQRAAGAEATGLEGANASMILNALRANASTQAKDAAAGGAAGTQGPFSFALKQPTGPTKSLTTHG